MGERSLWGGVGGDWRGMPWFWTSPSHFQTFLSLAPTGLLQNVILFLRGCSSLGQHQETVVLQKQTGTVILTKRSTALWQQWKNAKNCYFSWLLSQWEIINSSSSLSSWLSDGFPQPIDLVLTNLLISSKKGFHWGPDMIQIAWLWGCFVWSIWPSCGKFF